MRFHDEAEDNQNSLAISLPGKPMKDLAVCAVDTGEWYEGANSNSRCESATLDEQVSYGEGTFRARAQGRSKTK
jgi:hypothetical protein